MFISIILGVLAASHPASAQDDRAVDPDNHFLFPPLPGAQYTKDPSVFWNNINVTLGVTQTQPFKWLSDMTSMKVTLQQEAQTGEAQYREISSCSPGSFNTVYWDGRIDPIDVNNGTQAYLAAWNCSNPKATPIFFSHYFNLTQEASSSAGSPTTTGDSRQTTAPLSTSTTSTPTSVATTSTPSSSLSNTTPSNNAALIGGGVGGGIGGALLVVAAGLLFWRHHKKSDSRHGSDDGRFLESTQWNSHEDEHKRSMGPTPAYVEHEPPKHLARYGPSELA